MGRLLLGITALILYSSAVLAGYSTNKKDLERAAELAVERAAEKAAERAVEKALNTGNSSTVTVTIKESYENAKKTAEEQAAPGSESTRPFDPKIHDRQYNYVPPAEGEYKVSDSAEAKELGISQESLNSSVEDLGSTENPETAAAADSAEGEEPEEPAEASFESAKETGDKSGETDGSGGVDSSAGLDFGADFGSFDDLSSDPEFKGEFGMKSNTKTFSSSYSKPKEGFPETKVDVDASEDAKIFGMYADFDQGSGWSSTKQKGWVRHRPLWDDTKSRVSRGSNQKKSKGSGSYWDIFSEIFEKENKEVKKPEKTEDHSMKLFKRMAVDEDHELNDHIAVPLATLTLDPKAPSALYHLLERELKLQVPANRFGSKTPVPMKIYVTIPAKYLPALKRSEQYEQREVDSSPVSTKPSELILPPKQLNDEMNYAGSLTSRQPYKRSHNIYTLGSRFNRRKINPNVALVNPYHSVIRGGQFMRKSDVNPSTNATSLKAT